MKKSKLIEILNSIEGNPEIKLWNGFVQDYVEIDPTPVESVLTRMSLDYWLESCRLQDCIQLKDWSHQMPQEEIDQLKKNYRDVCKWEMNDFVKPEDVKSKYYKNKKVVILQAKIKGEDTFDRCGSIKY
jgi:hypothetical protein